MIKINYSFPDMEALKNHLTEAYNLPFCVLDLYRAVRGALYIAYTPQKKYVFKLSDAYYAEKTINAVNLITFLRKRNFPAVEIIPASKGELYISIPMPEGNRIGVLYEFIEGKAATFDDIGEVGKTAARLHNEMNLYTGIMPNLYDKRLLIDELPKTLRLMRYDEDKTNDIERMINALWDAIKAFPSGIVHGDFDVGNIIIKDDGAITLIDFDDGGRMPLIFDVACICSRIGDELLTKEKVELTQKTIELFLNGYHAINPHAEFKTRDIMNWIALRRIDTQMIGIRFLLQRRGKDNQYLFFDRTHKWLMDWEKMFL